MTRSTRWPLRLFSLLMAAGLGSAGCGGDPPAPPVDSEQFKEAVKEREQVIQKEYGGGGPGRPKAKR